MQAIFKRHLIANGGHPGELIASGAAAQRFAVYRNNIYHGLIMALATRQTALRASGKGCILRQRYTPPAGAMTDMMPWHF